MKNSLKSSLLTVGAVFGMVACSDRVEPDYAQHDYEMLSKIPAKTYYVQGKPPKWDQKVKNVAECLVLAQEFAKQSALKNKAGACLSEKETIIAYVDCNEDRACQFSFRTPYYHLNKK